MSRPKPTNKWTVTPIEKPAEKPDQVEFQAFVRDMDRRQIRRLKVLKSKGLTRLEALYAVFREEKKEADNL